MYEIKFYTTLRGDAPVREYIDQLGEKSQNKVLAFIKKLESEGHELRRPTAAHLGHKLWELRPDSHRVLYAFYGKSKIVLLHAFNKKSDAVPTSDLDLALRRLKDWLSRGHEIKGEI